MNNPEIIVLILLASIGSACTGYMIGQHGVMFWRIKWIVLEHETARLLNKEPRDISEVEDE